MYSAVINQVLEYVHRSLGGNILSMNALKTLIIGSMYCLPVSARQLLC
jgi:hypothetical protein